MMQRRDRAMPALATSQGGRAVRPIADLPEEVQGVGGRLKASKGFTQGR